MQQLWSRTSAKRMTSSPVITHVIMKGKVAAESESTLSMNFMKSKERADPVWTSKRADSSTAQGTIKFLNITQWRIIGRQIRSLVEITRWTQEKTHNEWRMVPAMTTSGHCLAGGRLSSPIVPLSRNHLITCGNSSRGTRTSAARLIARPCPGTPVQSQTAPESLSLAQMSLNISRSAQNLTTTVIAIAATISKTRAHAAVSSIWTWSREKRKAYSPGKLSKRSCLCCKESWNTTCTRSLRTEASHKEILTSWPSQRIWKT